MARFNKDNIRIALQGFAMVVISIITLAATSIIQFYYNQRQLYEEATRRAEDQMEATNLRITSVMEKVETVVRNNVWGARNRLSQPDSLWTVTRRVVETNDFIVGCAIALRENYDPDKGRMFSPFSYRRGSTFGSTQLGTEEYNYLEKEWFVKPLETGEGYWSEPYFDEGGGEMLMTTYSVPLTDNDGKIAGVITSDVSLDWLTDLVGSIKGYPNAFSVLASRTGQLMVCPSSALVMKQTMQNIARTLDDSASVNEVVQGMLAGKRGEKAVLYNGVEELVFYAPVERAGWSMAIVVPSNEIYGEMRRLGGLINLLQVLGLLILIYLIYVFAKNQQDLREVSKKKNRIENELHVAREIQMSMLPKTFPPYPERNDIDMFGIIVPAKEVGGDLYDFFIRDEKFFFCIGDVSGKGIPASLVMAVTRSLFRTVSAHEASPQRIVTSMNDSMSDMNESSMFVTFLVGILDLRSGHLRYCNAGHNAPLLTRPGRAALELEVTPNMPLGVVPGFHYQEQEADLCSHEGLFLYTDGLTEAEDSSHRLFGLDKLLDVAAHIGNDSAEMQVKKVVEDVNEHIGDSERSDDLTMFVLRFTNPAPTTGAERHLILHNDVTQIPQLADFIETIAMESKLDQGVAMSLNLALEEAVTNVIMYAYPEGSDGLVEVEAIIWKDHLDFIVTDSGVPFDPTSISPPDLSLDAIDRPVGGLGIYLVNSIMDHVSYERKDGKNILSMTKKL